ncbi:MAG: NUDIX hydrolase [Alphaproteobacteria bacterium]|nr:NUDIX hydrolase [Alphaproteobacteria bacterium]
MNQAPKPQVTPLPSATLVLMRDGAAGLEVLLVARNRAVDFASGASVFPGGKIDPVDHTLAARCAGAAHLGPPTLAHRVAAIRETFEECGILLARLGTDDRLMPQTALTDMKNRHEAPIDFSAFLAAGSLRLATDLLVPFAHWITPIDRPKRFDTQFFLAPAPDDQIGVHDGREAVDLLWTTPAGALRAADEGRIKLVFATRLNLMKLGRHRSVADAMAAARGATIVTVMPEFVPAPDGPAFRIPAAADYGHELVPASGIPRA